MIMAPEEGYIGNPNPDYKLGITNTFTYKGFQLSVLFDMTIGGDIYSETVNSLLGRGVTLDTKDQVNNIYTSGCLWRSKYRSTDIGQWERNS